MSALADFFLQHRRLLKPHVRVLLACSGGPDSVALAHALREYQFHFEFHVEMAHVNHQLRGGASKADEMLVRSLAKRMKWPCHVERCSVKSLESGNLEEVARDRRYEALIQIARRRRCTVLFTAHTLDDQVETVLMNIMRGTGPDGLSGIAPVRKMEQGLWLCRPLLNVTKAELLKWLTVSKGRFRQDKSNTDESFLRNWVRRSLVPMIESRSVDFKSRIRSLAGIALDEKAHWDQEMALLEKQLLKPYKGGRLLDLGGLLRYSSAVQRRFLRRSLGRDVLTFEAVERLRNWMQSPPTGGRLWQLRKGWSVERLSKSKGSPSARFFWLKHTNPGKEKYHP